MPNAHRTKPDIDIGKTDPEQAEPGPEHVTAVQATDTGKTFRADGLLRGFVKEPADQMTQRMTTKGVTGKENDVYHEHQCADTEAEMFPAICASEPQGFPS